MMDLPRANYMSFTPPYQRLRCWVQWLLLAFCITVTLVRLETPCSHGHKALNDIGRAKAEFHGRDPQHLPPDPDWCAAKVRDVSSWVRAGPSKPPFHFPNIIHQTVEDKHNISCEVLECMQTWTDMNPGYEHRLYDAKDRDAFVAQHYPEVLSVYRSLSTNVERADLWRYLALHRHGGVYADSDVRCTQPIIEWNAANSHDADLLLGVVYTDPAGMVTRVNNFIIAAMPCHPVMAAMPFTALSRIAAAGLAGKPVGGETGKALSEAVIGRTGPAALTATIGDYAKRLGAVWPVNGTQGATSNAGNLVASVRLMPRNVMTMGWETAAEKITCDEALARNPGAYICHQYFGTWKASYNHRPALTYNETCQYWGLNATAAAAPPPPVAPSQPPRVFSDAFEQTLYMQQQEDGMGDDEEGGDGEDSSSEQGAAGQQQEEEAAEDEEGQQQEQEDEAGREQQQ